VLEQLLKTGVDVNARDTMGRTFLMQVAKRATRGTSTIDMLLDHGADASLVDNTGRDALSHAIALNNHSRPPCRRSMYVLALASALGRSPVSVDVRGEDGRTGMSYLALHSCYDCISEYIKVCVNPHMLNADGSTPLHFAQDWEVAQMLLEAGATDAVDDEGCSALMRACRHEGRTKIVELMLKFNFDVNLANKHGGTALHVAMLRGDASLVEMLLGAGAQVLGGGAEAATVLMGAFEGITHDGAGGAAGAEGPGGSVGAAGDVADDARASECLELVMEHVLSLSVASLDSWIPSGEQGSGEPCSGEPALGEPGSGEPANAEPARGVVRGREVKVEEVRELDVKEEEEPAAKRVRIIYKPSAYAIYRHRTESY
jgi:ankyrin repeat protein